MFEKLYLAEWPSQVTLQPSIIEGSRSFVLSTCQRTLIATVDQDLLNKFSNMTSSYTLEGHQAYRHLLSIVCGLESKLLGENEIVSQFRKSLQEYTLAPWKNNNLLGILERILKDAKFIRTEHLLNIGQYSYAGLSKKILQQRQKLSPILILGSGELAQNLCKILNRHFPLTILARNLEKAQALSTRYQANLNKQWGQWHSEIKNFSAIVNTIPSCHQFNMQEAMGQWYAHHQGAKTTWIDLAQDNNPKFIHCDGHFSLAHLFDMGAELGREKEFKAQQARMGLDQIIEKRYPNHYHNLNEIAIHDREQIIHAGF